MHTKLIFKKFIFKFILIIFMFLFIQPAIVLASPSNNTDLNKLNLKIENLEKENKSLRDDLNKINKDKLIESYKDQNENILKSTDLAIKNITILISVVAVIIAFLTAIGTIIYPLRADKKEKERFGEVKNKIASIEKSLDKLYKKESLSNNSFNDLDKRLNSLKDDVNKLLDNATQSAEKAKESENIAKSYSLESEAIKLSKNKKYDLALKKYNESIKLNPNNLDTLCNRGNIYKILKKYTLALDDYTNALKIDSNDLITLYNRGNLYIQLGKYDLALDDYNNALKINPNDTKTLGNRGNLYTQLGKYDLALDDYNNALKINPNDKTVINNKAALYREIGKLDLAREEIAAALAIDNNDPYILSTAAEIALAKNDKEDFYKNIEKALENGLPLNVIYEDDLYKKVLDEPRFKQLLEKYKKNDDKN